VRPRGRWIASVRTHLVCADTAHVRADAGVHPHGHARFRADASVLFPCNFITDALVRPSHGRLSGHHPTVRPSVIVRVTTLG
jgi:hypothetical protein